ncbi:MAG: LytR/AlgR family response regulator transcription factor [Oceanococcus sp.]
MKILIVDDEVLARERLCALVEQFPGYEVVGQTGDGQNALNLINELEPDVVLLDIRMPGMDGLQVARALNQVRLPPAVIFTTAFSEHAISAFDTIASGYLLKPIKREKLGDALQNARRPSKAQLAALQQKQSDSTSNGRSHIVANTRDGQLRIPVEDIIYFLADQKYTTVYHLQGDVLIEESLRHLEDDLVPPFLRIHRKILVNTSYIVGLERSDNQGLHGAQLSLRHCNDKLPVSRRRLAEIRRLLFKNAQN